MIMLESPDGPVVWTSKIITISLSKITGLSMVNPSLLLIPKVTSLLDKMSPDLKNSNSMLPETPNLVKLMLILLILALLKLMFLPLVLVILMLTEFILRLLIQIPILLLLLVSLKILKLTLLSLLIKKVSLATKWACLLLKVTLFFLPEIGIN